MAAILLITLGALNAILAINVGTCTQGGAGNLYGGVLTLLLYGAGAAAFLIAPPRRAVLIGLVPAESVAAWHSGFALRFARGFWMEGMSACYALHGGFTPDEAGEWMDGGEPMLSALWLLTSLLFWAVFGLAAFRGRRRRAAP